MTMQIDTSGPQQRSMRELRRVGIWGLVTLTILAIAVSAATSESGERRLSQLAAKLNPLRSSPRPEDSDIRKLVSALQTLSIERDRLAARLDLLERNVGEITGSIRRTPAPATPQPAPQPEVATPEIAAPVSPDPGSARAEFGIDLGAAPNVEALRAMWAAAKSRHGALLDDLRPVIAIRESTRGGGIELRLVAGPIANAAAAARLCSAIVGTGALCQPAVFEGQRLALR